MGLFDVLFPGKAYCAFCGYLNSNEARNIKNGSYKMQRSQTFGGMITKENPVMCPDCGLQMPLTDNVRMAKQNGLKHGFERDNDADLTKDERGRHMGPTIGASSIQSVRYLMDPTKWT